MPQTKRNKAREERITMEIIVDAYGSEEQAMGRDEVDGNGGNGGNGSPEDVVPPKAEGEGPTLH